MTDQSTRRGFLRSGALGTATAMTTTLSAAATSVPAVQEETPKPVDPLVEQPPAAKENYDGFSRFRPSRGDDPDSPFYLGKLVPGFRTPADGPAPFIANDLDKLPWKLKDGAKEFHLVCQPVRREFLPGYSINLYGFNGSMPGPTIEIHQGDRIRIIVHNELPEETTVHWHGFELPIQMDGSETMTQNPIPPGKSFQYEFDVHESGTFFYHSHVAMQENFGMVGWMIVHPRKNWDPPVDRDFGVIFQNFRVDPMQTVSDSWSMDWNWHTINGRSGPLATPLVCKHGERVRVRILNFSPVQHHPIHIHGHTFWVTGHEGTRIPKTAWVPRNTELIAVAQASDFEFIANNPGDWMFHCHMTHHMMNHMVQHVGPRMRSGPGVDAYLSNLDSPPQVHFHDERSGHVASAQPIPGFPQKMQGMMMNMETMKRLWARREVKGMRAQVMMAMMGLMTAVRVLPEDLYHRVMETHEDVPKDAIFEEIVNRFGNLAAYQPSPKDHMHP